MFRCPGQTGIVGGATAGRSSEPCDRSTGSAWRGESTVRVVSIGLVHLSAATALVLAGCAKEPEVVLPEKEPPTLVLETNKGRIVIEFDPTRAPNTTEFVVRHVRAGFYNGLAFHRVIPQSIVQTGRMTAERLIRRTQAQPFESEADNGLRHRRGTVGLGRDPRRPHSGNTQFFVNLANNEALNHTGKTTDQGWGYTVFGRVIDGMSVADAIGRVKTVESGSREFWPLEPIVIDTSYMMKIDPPADSTTTESDL